jgi:hypothetical protein
MKPSFEEFTGQLELKFGPLPPHIKHCAEDIYSNYALLSMGIIANTIHIVVSPFELANKLKTPEYTKYQMYQGASTIAFIVSIVLFFFDWKWGLGCLVLSMVLNGISNFLKRTKSEEFAANLKMHFYTNINEAMFDLSCYYISGIIQLSGIKGKAHLPLIPSCVLTGKKIYAGRPEK